MIFEASTLVANIGNFFWERLQVANLEKMSKITPWSREETFLDNFAQEHPWTVLPFGEQFGQYVWGESPGG